MGLRIQQARSSVANKQPAATDLDFGELALNFSEANPFLTVKDSDGTIRRLDRVEVSAGAPANPTEGQLWFDISTPPGTLRVFDGSGWPDASGITLPGVATPTTLGLVRTADNAAITAGTPGRVVDAAQLKAVDAKVAQSDWNAASGSIAEILNKPTIPAPYTLPTATPTVLGGVRTASSTDAANGNAGKVVDAAQLKVVGDVANAALPQAGGTVTGALIVNGGVTADVTGDLTGDVTGSVTGALTGNADTATKLAVPVNINGVAFDGSADITIDTGDGTTDQPLTAGQYLTGAAFDGSAAVTWDVQAATTATGGTLVARDANGDIQVGKVIGNLQGTADLATTADALTAPRAINGIQFDGSQDINIPIDAQPTPNVLSPGLYLAGNDFDGSSAETFDVVADVPAVPDTLAARDATGGLTATTFNGALAGNADTASSAAKLTTPRNINGIAFDGTQDITVPSTPGNQAPLTPGLFMLGQVYTGATATRFDVDAKIGAEPDSVAARDGSGNLRANTFIGGIQLASPLTFWGQTFDGTGNVSGPLSGVTDINGRGIPSSGNLASTNDLTPGRDSLFAYELVRHVNSGTLAAGATVAGSGLRGARGDNNGEWEADNIPLSGTYRIHSMELADGRCGLAQRIA